MDDKGGRVLAQGGIAVSQEYYDSLSDEEKQSGHFSVDDGSPLEVIAGATFLAQKAGFTGTSITPFVYEYLTHQRQKRSEEV